MAGKGNDYKQPTREELQAMREVKAQGDPRAEAQRHEQFFLGQMAGAKEHLDWIISHQAWVILGHATFADWWEARAVPVAAGLGMRPTRDMAKVVIGTIVEEQKALPPGERRSQREIAGMVGVGLGTVNRQARPRADRQNGTIPSVPNGTEGDPVERFPAVKDAVQKTLDAQPAAADTDHRDLLPGETGDSPAVESPGPSAPAGVFGADKPTAPEAPLPPAQATGEVEGQTPEGKPASAPPPPDPGVPAYIRKASALFEAIYDLAEEDPAEVGAIAPDDLSYAITEATSTLLGWCKAMQDALPATEETA